MPNLFPILIDVEELAVGRVLRRLHTLPGVAHIHLRLADNPKQLTGPDEEEPEALVPAVQRVKIPDGRAVRWHGTPAQSKPYRAIAEVLQKTPAHIRMLGAALVRVGLPSIGISGYLFRMMKLKLVRRTAPGTYALTEKGMEMFFHKVQPHHLSPRQKLLARANNRVPDNAVGFRALMLRVLKNALDSNPNPDSEGLVASETMKRIVIEAGFSDKNLSTTGMKMREESLISVKDGWYSITKHGIAVFNTLPNELHGNNPSNEEEQVTHG